MPGAPNAPPPTAGEETGAVQCSQSEGAEDVPLDVKWLTIFEFVFVQFKRIEKTECMTVQSSCSSRNKRHILFVENKAFEYC